MPWVNLAWAMGAPSMLRAEHAVYAERAVAASEGLMGARHQRRSGSLLFVEDEEEA